MNNEEKARSILSKVKNNIRQVFIGKDDVIDSVLAAMICGGHILIEDVPGLGKTTLVSALARSLNCSFRRIQFTPDVLPTDITGFTLFNMKTGEREVNFGAVMAQIVLADEINRTSPKTQSSLLEVMQEGQITIDGETYPVPQPFFVLATQNPAGHVGTYPLPESQLDRFLMKISIGYPSKTNEMEILKRHKGIVPMESIHPVADAKDILFLRSCHAKTTCAQPVMDYIVSISEATRRHEKVSLGVSPRGSLALMNAAMAAALINGRNYTLPDDVQQMSGAVLSHRLVIDQQQFQSQYSPQSIIRDIIRSIKVPGVS